MKKLNNIPSFSLPVLAVVIIASLLLIFEADLLWKTQETNLFLNSKIFFKEMMVEPGGFLSWVSAYFTQYFFHPWVGVLLLCGWWLLLMWLVKRTFRVTQRWIPITVIPVLFLLVTIVDMGYWVYILKLRGHVFLGTIGTTVVVALLWVFRVLSEKIKNQSTRGVWIKTLLLCLFVVLTCAVGYALLGIYGVGAAALMAMWVWRLEHHRASALIIGVVGALSVWLLPLFFYRFVYYQTNIVNVYAAKLPLYYIQEEYTGMYVPFVLVLLFLLVMTLVRFKEKDARPKVKTSNLKLQLPNLKSLLLMAAAAVYTGYFWYHDENFHHELAMQRSIEYLDWEGVLEEAAKQEDTPTRAIVMMRNLALARLGRQGNEMCHYKNGCKKCNAPFDVRAMHSVGMLIYYHYGLTNYCHRLCTENGVEFGWRAEHLKYMSRCAILNGEWGLARKFLGLLKQTTFYDTWTEQYSDLVEHPENIANSPEMGFITHMMHYDEALTADHNLIEEFLKKRLVGSNYTDDPIFQEQKILESMIAKDVNSFWVHLYNYYTLYPERTWPIHVQEAAYLFGKHENRDIEHAPISSAVKGSYERFNAAAPRFRGQSIEAAAEALYPAFGNTFFYDYYLVNFPGQN